MFLCTTVLYKYMKSRMNLVLILTDNTHVRIQIYQDFITAITIYIMKDAMLYHDNTLSHNLI
jgi:hypothetical protein